MFVCMYLRMYVVVLLVTSYVRIASFVFCFVQHILPALPVPAKQTSYANENERIHKQNIQKKKNNAYNCIIS